jgi:metal-sulfur cluster biosynthetic enzyme
MVLLANFIPTVQVLCTPTITIRNGCELSLVVFQYITEYVSQAGETHTLQVVWEPVVTVDRIMTPDRIATQPSKQPI